MVNAKWIPRVAATVYFVIILLQVPLFRVPCRTGVCTTPLHVTIGQMGASGFVPPAVIKACLFPGAVFYHAFRGDALTPVWGNLLQEYNMTAFGPTSAAYKFRLEVVAGSYFACGGAVVSLIKPGRMSMFGLLLIFWGLIKDKVFARPAYVDDDPADLVHMDVKLILALALALLSVRYDMKKIQKLGAPIGKPLRSSTRAKLKRR